MNNRRNFIGKNVIKSGVYVVVAILASVFAWQFFNMYISGSRASFGVDALVTTSSQEVSIGENFTINLFLDAGNSEYKISQLDLRYTISGADGGAVDYVSRSAESGKAGNSDQVDYFDSIVTESSNDTSTRVVLTSRKATSELSDKVNVQITFTATQAGEVTFTLSEDVVQIVGPGVGEESTTSYTIQPNSTLSTTVRIASDVIPPTPTITLAPAPTCSTTQTLEDGSIVCADTRAMAQPGDSHL